MVNFAQRRTVLLVEDDPDDELLSLKGLRDIHGDLDVVIARDGLEAINTLDKLVPELIICDLKLPKISGKEILSMARANSALDNVPIVMFTSSMEPADVEFCRARGANGYVQKPMQLGPYLNRVKDIVSHWVDGEAENPLSEEGIEDKTSLDFSLPRI